MKSRPTRKTVEELSDPQCAAERIAACTLVTPTGCHEWQGHRNPKGYGRMSVASSGKYVHRLAWVIANGEIPLGMLVCHACDNPPCCNPDHLFLGSNIDNVRDMQAKGRKPSPITSTVMAFFATKHEATAREVIQATGLPDHAVHMCTYHLRRSGHLEIVGKRSLTSPLKGHEFVMRAGRTKAAA